MVSRYAFGGIFVCSSRVMSSSVLLNSDGTLGRVGLRWWSMYDEIFSVGSLILLTIGLIPCGVLWIFFRN